MKNWKSVLIVLSGILTVLLISILGATSAGHAAYKADVMAAWVQAVGSIAAILGAFALARLQIRNDLDRYDSQDRMSQLREGKLAEIVARDAYEAIRDHAKYINSYNAAHEFDHRTDRLEEARMSLRTLYARSIPAPILEDLLVLHKQTTYSIRAIEQRHGLVTVLKTRTRTGAADRATLARDAWGRIEIWVRSQETRAKKSKDLQGW